MIAKRPMTGCILKKNLSKESRSNDFDFLSSIDLLLTKGTELDFILDQTNYEETNSKIWKNSYYTNSSKITAIPTKTTINSEMFVSRKRKKSSKHTCYKEEKKNKHIIKKSINLNENISSLKKDAPSVKTGLVRTLSSWY